MVLGFAYVDGAVQAVNCCSDREERRHVATYYLRW